MEKSISQLLSSVYELEGLLLVVERHGADTPQVVFDSIKAKGELIGELSQLVRAPQPEPTPHVVEPIPVVEPEPEPVVAPEPASHVVEPSPIVEPEPEPEPMHVVEPSPVAEEEPIAEREPEEDKLPADDYDADETWQHDNGEEFKEIFGTGFEYQEPHHSSQQPPVQEPESPAADDAFVSPYAPEPESPSDAQWDDVPEYVEPIRVDEKLQRTLSRDMHKAFSVNDRFRFRRELFSNSDVEMEDALNMIEAMKCYEEAEDYFYNTLGWNDNNEEVALFMAIVRNHFA
ncbi:MAG: hypothetical protein IK092_00675 [Muribaculaceae bacterium]|nr:hypothetical protein [Muribaculaceae bacterium]